MTFFFELLLERESPENISCFLTCHNLQLNPDPGKFKGIINDFAFRLDEYLLDREGKHFLYLRLLVDGSHWQSQNRQKKPNNKGKGGHYRCSDGFIFFIFHVCICVCMIVTNLLLPYMGIERVVHCSFGPF